MQIRRFWCCTYSKAEFHLKIIQVLGNTRMQLSSSICCGTLLSGCILLLFALNIYTLHFQKVKLFPRWLIKKTQKIYKLNYVFNNKRQAP